MDETKVTTNDTGKMHTMIQRLNLTTSIHKGKSDLERAYDLCADITREHSKSFFFSTRFLPADKRLAIRAFYALCRTTDDLVDIPCRDISPVNNITAWRQQSRLPYNHQNNPILIAWADVRDRYQVQQNYIEELIDGCEMDLCIKRYESFAELQAYCYRVASTVGLVSMHIIGTTSSDQASLAQARDSAVKLGIALQLTNILRDIGEDLARGRIYLPSEDMQRFHYSEADLHTGIIDERFRALMRFEIDRANQLYTAGWPGIAYLKPDGRLAVGAAIALYRGILDRIVQNDFNVFTHRAHLTTLAKISHIPSIYLRVKSLQPTCAE
jgi:15-cis-phytoene synthase